MNEAHLCIWTCALRIFNSVLLQTSQAVRPTHWKVTPLVENASSMFLPYLSGENDTPLFSDIHNNTFLTVYTTWLPLCVVLSSSLVVSIMKPNCTVKTWLSLPYRASKKRALSLKISSYSEQIQKSSTRKPWPILVAATDGISTLFRKAAAATGCWSISIGFILPWMIPLVCKAISSRELNWN